MRTLVFYEIKKILQKKSIWITGMAMLLFLIITTTANYFGSTYVEGEYLESHAEAIETAEKNGKHLSGRKIDDALLKEMQNAYGQVVYDNDFAYLRTETYQKDARPYEAIYEYVMYLRAGENHLDPLAIGESELYQARSEGVKAAWSEYELTEQEKEYWKERERKLEEPFTYQYAEGYAQILYMSGIYMVSMIMTFFIAICMSGIFTEEHTKKTDQLLLCARLGRGKLYAAKIIAGEVVSLGILLFYLLVCIICNLSIYGTKGFSAAIQMIMPLVSYQATMGQILWIAILLLVLSTILITCFTMVLAEVMRSSIGAMAVLIAGLFIARLLNIPLRYRVMSQIWNYVPINMLKLDQGLLDYRLVSVGGFSIQSWQVAGIIYLLLSVLIIGVGKRIYCSYQVSGR